MTRPPDTREDLRRALVVNALTKPLNVLVPALVVVAASLLGAALLIVVALICWLGLALVTFFDEDEAARRRPPAAGGRARAPARPPHPSPSRARPRSRAGSGDAHAAADSVQEAVRESELPLADVTGEVDELVALIERNAARVDRMHRFLAEHPLPAAAPEEQRRAVARLEARHQELLVEIDRAASALDTVHAEVLAADGLAELEARQALAGARRRPPDQGPRRFGGARRRLRGDARGDQRGRSSYNVTGPVWRESTSKPARAAERKRRALLRPGSASRTRPPSATSRGSRRTSASAFSAV